MDQKIIIRENILSVTLDLMNVSQILDHLLL